MEHSAGQYLWEEVKQGYQEREQQTQRQEGRSREACTPRERSTTPNSHVQWETHLVGISPSISLQMRNKNKQQQSFIFGIAYVFETGHYSEVQASLKLTV